MFTIFEGDNPDAVVHILMRSSNAIKEFNQKVFSKQMAFNKKLLQCQKNGKRINRDSIRFDFEDVLSMKSCEFFDANQNPLTRSQFIDLFH